LNLIAFFVRFWPAGAAFAGPWAFGGETDTTSPGNAPAMDAVTVRRPTAWGFADAT
jgi:hypothetical protein